MNSPKRKTRATEVLKRCTALRKELTHSYKDLKGRLTAHLSNLHLAMNDLHVVTPMSWKDSAKYISVKERIRKMVQEEEDKDLGEQVTYLQQLASEQDPLSNPVKLTISKTKQTAGKKAKEVREQLFLPVQMLNQFNVAHQLERDKRAFGGARRRSSDSDEMDDFWKSEVVRYKRDRVYQLIDSDTKAQVAHRKSIIGFMNKKEALLHTNPSAFCHYRQYQLAEVAASRRRERIEAKMTAIQPSPDVLRLAKKYLPKSVKVVKRPKPVLVKVQDKPQHEAKRSLSADLRPEEDFILEEIRREMTDTKGLQRMATMVRDRDRNDLVKRK